MLRRDEEFHAALDRLKSEVDGTVRIAAIYSVGLSEMSELEQEFSRRYPGAQLEVEYLRPEKVYEAVVSDRADLGLMSYAEPDSRGHRPAMAGRGDGGGGCAHSSAGAMDRRARARTEGPGLRGFR